MAELLRQDRLRVEDIQMRLSDDADEKKFKKEPALLLASTTWNEPLMKANMGSARRTSTVGNQ